jgi:hypothetical protein
MEASQIFASSQRIAAEVICRIAVVEKISSVSPRQLDGLAVVG